MANGVVYMASNDGSVFALDARTGGELWRRFIGDPVGSSPTVADGVVYIGSEDNYVYAFSLK